MQRILKSTVTLALIMLSQTLSSVQAEPVATFVANEKTIREEMVTISRELGVTCNTCHNVQNFKSDKKTAYKVSKEHMKLTQMLKDNGFDGHKGPKATCYMCHRGKLVPDYKEPARAKSF